MESKVISKHHVHKALRLGEQEAYFKILFFSLDENEICSPQAFGWSLNLYYSRVRVFRSHSDKRRTSNYQNTKKKRVKKNVDDISGMLYKCAEGWGWA